MSAYISELALLIAVFSVAIIVPGADLAMILRQSLIHGRQNAIITALGIGTALFVHTTYTILGLGLIISQSLVLFNVIKWIGVVYLFYIGIRALQARGIWIETGPSSTLERKKQTVRKAFMLGFMVNILNPKAVFFFLTIFSTIVAADTPIGVKFGYGVVMSASVILWFTLVSLFMTTPAMRQLFSRASKWIDRLSGIIFIGLGIRLMFQNAS